MSATAGGLGGESGGARDTRLVERAVRKRWAIPDPLRAALPGVLGRILADPQASPRNKIAAARAVLAADALNLEQEKRDALAAGELPAETNVNVTVNAVGLTLEQAGAAAKEVEAWERERGLPGPPAGGPGGGAGPAA
jgi:hypothetical protein